MKSRVQCVYNILGDVEIAHCLLYAWLLAGKFWVLSSGEIPLPDSTSHAIKVAWLAIGFAAPTMIFLAYWLLHWKRGRWRYIGMWLRLGGDVSQVMIMIIFLTGLLSGAFGNDTEGHHVFTAFFVAAILHFLVIMIVRDVLAIVRTETVAWGIRRKE